MIRMMGTLGGRLSWRPKPRVRLAGIVEHLEPDPPKNPWWEDALFWLFCFAALAVIWYATMRRYHGK